MKQPKRIKRITNCQLQWLKALAKGDDPGLCLRGRSEHGGAAMTVGSLQRIGAIDARRKITAFGKRLVISGGLYEPAIKSDDTIDVPKQLFLDLVWLQAFDSSQLNGRDGGERWPVKLPASLEKTLTDRERRARADAGEEADAPRVALMLDADELGAVVSACDMVLRGSSGEGPYLDGAQRVLNRLGPYALLVRKAGLHK